MGIYQIELHLSDGTVHTLSNSKTEKDEEFGLKDRARMFTTRDEINPIDYTKEEDEAKLVETSTGNVEFAGIIHDVKFSEGEAIIMVDGYEQDAHDEEYIKDQVWSRQSDGTIIEGVIRNLDKLTASTIENISNNITQEFTDVSHAQAIRQVAEIAGGHPIYNYDRTVDYVSRRGRDRPNTVLTPSNRNITFSKPDKEDKRRTTHLRMIGAGTKVDVEAEWYEPEDREAYTKNEDYSHISDEDKLTNIGKQLISREEKFFTRVTADIKNIEVNLGDKFTVWYPEQDLNRTQSDGPDGERLFVTQLTTIYDNNGVTYNATLSSKIPIAAALDYNSNPVGWTSFRSSQESRGYTEDSVSPEDRWDAGLVANDDHTATQRTEPEIVCSGDSIGAIFSVGGSDAAMRVYDAQSGDQRFEESIGSAPAIGCLFAGQYFVGVNENAEIKAVDKYTKKEIASVSGGHSVDGPPQHKNGIIYVGDDDAGKVRGYDLYNGLTEVYTSETANGTQLDSVAVGSDKVYVSASSGGITAFSLEDGTKQWNALGGHDALWSPGYYDGYVTVMDSIGGGDTGNLYIVDDEGNKQWEKEITYKSTSGYLTHNTPTPVLMEPPALVRNEAVDGSDGVVCLTVEDQDGYALTIRDVKDGGTVLDTVALDGSVIPQVAVGRGTAYVATEGSTNGLYVINLSQGNVSELEAEQDNGMIVSPSVGRNVITAVAHKEDGDSGSEHLNVWYSQPEGEPGEASGPGDDDDREYDDTPGDTSEYEYIDRVEFGSIGNQSGDNNGYADFTGKSIKLLAEGSNGDNSAEITVHSSTGNNENHIAVYVDWNRTGDMSNAERYNLGTVNDNGGEPATTSRTISVPDDADVANVTMRVVQSRESYSEPPTGGGWYGEMEDYTIEVVEEGGLGPPESGVEVDVEVNITSTNDPIPIDGTLNLEAEIVNNESFDLQVVPRLVMGGVVASVGLNRTLPGNSKITVNFSWDAENWGYTGAYPPIEEGESRSVQACVKAKEVRVTDDWFSDRATVTVGFADYIVSGTHTATDNKPNESDATTVASGLSDIDSVAANISYSTRELDTSEEGEYPDTSTIRIELGGTTLAEKTWEFDSEGNRIGGSGSMPSGDHTFDNLGGLSGDLKIYADEAEITLSAP
jgi:hypothetical protein